MQDTTLWRQNRGSIYPAMDLEEIGNDENDGNYISNVEYHKVLLVEIRKATVVCNQQMLLFLLKLTILHIQQLVSEKKTILEIILVPACASTVRKYEWLKQITVNEMKIVSYSQPRIISKVMKTKTLIAKWKLKKK